MYAVVRPSERFAAEIQPALSEYEAQPANERLAVNLARAVDHHLEWTFKYYCEGDRTRLSGAHSLAAFRQQMLGLCPELRMMWDISDAAHHRFLTVPATPPRIVKSATASFSTRGAELWVQNYGRPFRASAHKAVEFWRHWRD